MRDPDQMALLLFAAVALTIVVYVGAAMVACVSLAHREIIAGTFQCDRQDRMYSLLMEVLALTAMMTKRK